MELNANFDERVFVHSERIAWKASPMPGVGWLRKASEAFCVPMQPMLERSRTARRRRVTVLLVMIDLSFVGRPASRAGRGSCSVASPTMDRTKPVRCIAAGGRSSRAARAALDGAE